MADPLAAALDLGARETLLDALEGLAADPSLGAIVLVTHHLEEVPTGITHALVLRAGRVLATGPIDAVVTDEVLSAAFGLDLVVDRRDGRYAVRRSGATRRP